MTDELELARRSRRTAIRREARMAWANHLHMSVTVGWPRGVFGWICGAMLLLTPPAIFMLGVWLELRLKQRGRR